jgi:hypothetical protein
MHLKKGSQEYGAVALEKECMTLQDSANIVNERMLKQVEKFYLDHILGQQ